MGDGLRGNKKITKLTYIEGSPSFRWGSLQEDGILVFEVYDDEIIFFNQLSSTYSFEIKASPKDLDDFRDFLMEDFEEFYFPKPGESQDQVEIDKIVN
ncbi:MAG: hypothetical protein HRU19_32635 [Pseudobacteriovorax sp.]|nr:hypothetical protein [Pseudobacteriovorax sp.]